MKKIVAMLFITVLFSGCTTVKYTGQEIEYTEFDVPEVGKTMTVSLGDFLVEKGLMIDSFSLEVKQTVDGVFYTIPAGTYPEIGSDNYKYFYSYAGVSKAALADPIQGLSVDKKDGKSVCVVTIFGGSACYEAKSDRVKVKAFGPRSYQQTLIYNGRVGNRIKVGYREFSGNAARPAFSNEVEYDLSASKVIGYKGASLEILDANNSSITYKLLSNFK